MPPCIRNLGPVGRRWLAGIGVHTLEDLRRIGSLDAYRLLALRGEPVSLNLLWAMEGALRDLHWLELPPSVRAELRAALEAPWDPSGLVEF